MYELCGATVRIAELDAAGAVMSPRSMSPLSSVGSASTVALAVGAVAVTRAVGVVRGVVFAFAVRLLRIDEAELVAVALASTEPVA